MKKIGLALSGGGFRASLYHLGLVRFLRDAGILPQVTHITSVSGGSIFAAHLVLNWDRYNGSPNEFDAVAAELLSFVRLDVRNRIVRRFLLNMFLRWPRRLVGLSNRKLTRPGLLERHYEKHLYGDTSLFELPETPQLHLLTTNVSEGCLCSFSRNGLLKVRRQRGNGMQIDHIHVGLATVAMAVAASSAFPGFFPPLELTAADVGAKDGEFSREAYTDGGVFDNLGVRMFRILERPLLAECALAQDDFFDIHAVIKAVDDAGKSGEESPLRRLFQVLLASRRQAELAPVGNGQQPNGTGLVPAPAAACLTTTGNGASDEQMMADLSNVVSGYHFQNDPLFTGLKLADADAAALLHATRHDGRPLNAGDQRWLNRHLLEAAFQQATGRACFRRLNSGLDGVLVSDVGKQIEVRTGRAGGMVRTALRATDILMDRVWQLENENFQDTPGYVFAPMTEVVAPAEDPTAMHPELQRQTAGIRTDLDRFSPLEISSLVRHGYCVGRKVCRAHPDLFGVDLPRGAPWDPIPAPRGAAATATMARRVEGTGGSATPVTADARALQASGTRHIWSSLLDYRDWTSYIYVPILVPILLLLPYLIVTSYQHSHRVNQLMESFTQGSRDLEIMMTLLDRKPAPFTGVVPEEVTHLEEPDFTGFAILQDSRIVDLRAWHPRMNAESTYRIFAYQRLKVLKLPDNASNNLLRFRLMTTAKDAEIRFPRQQLEPGLRVAPVPGRTAGQNAFLREADFDFRNVPNGDSVDLLIESMSSGQELNRRGNSNTFYFDIHTDRAEMTMWVLMPSGMEYDRFQLRRHKHGHPEISEGVRPVTEYLADDYTILAFKLQALKGGYTYEIQWFYK